MTWCLESLGVYTPPVNADPGLRLSIMTLQILQLMMVAFYLTPADSKTDLYLSSVKLDSSSFNPVS